MERHHPPRRQADLRLRRGHRPEGHRDHPQGLRRRVRRDGVQAPGRRRQRRLAHRADRRDGRRGGGEHPLPQGAGRAGPATSSPRRRLELQQEYEDTLRQPLHRRRPRLHRRRDRAVGHPRTTSPASCGRSPPSARRAPRASTGTSPCERPPEERRALVRVVRGEPDDVEVAALAVVLAALAASPPPAPDAGAEPVDDRAAHLRRPLPSARTRGARRPGPADPYPPLGGAAISTRNRPRDRRPRRSRRSRSGPWTSCRTWFRPRWSSGSSRGSSPAATCPRDGRCWCRWSCSWSGSARPPTWRGPRSPSSRSSATSC